MNYGDAEQEIATRLNQHFQTIGAADKFVAAVMPETEDEAKEFEKLFPKVRAAIEYTESEYQKSSSLNGVKIIETVKFRLLFEGRKKRGEGGIFRMIEQTKLSLTGFKLANTDELIISGSGNLQYEPGVWMPYLDFECSTVNIQSFEPEQEILGGPFKGLGTTKDEFLTEFENSFQ